MPHYVCPNSHVPCIVTFVLSIITVGGGGGVSVRETPHGNVRAVRILLKCILVLKIFFFKIRQDGETQTQGELAGTGDKV